MVGWWDGGMVGWWDGGMSVEMSFHTRSNVKNTRAHIAALDWEVAYCPPRK